MSDASDLDRLCEAMAARKVSPSIISRVRRLNLAYRSVCVPRGIHRKQKPFSARFGAAIGKGEFIRRFGRDAWQGLRKQHQIKDGRRRFVMVEAVMSEVWNLWRGNLPAYCTTILLYEPDEFAGSLNAVCRAVPVDEFRSRFLGQS